MKNQQLLLFKDKIELSFGGSKLKGVRKSARPLSTKRPVHLVLKATNAFFLLRQMKCVEQVLGKYGKRFGVQIYELGVQADHLHICLRISNRDGYRKWIRAVASVLVVQISGLKWHLRPFTRIGSWGQDFKRVGNYIKKNRTEGEFMLNAHLRVDEWLAQSLAFRSYS